MRKTLSVVILFVVAVLCVYGLSVRSNPAAYAQAQKAQVQCSVPKSYGSPKFVTSVLLGFEDTNGTIRFVDMDENCKLVIAIVRE